MCHDAFRQNLVDAVLDSPGDTPSELRYAVFERANVPPELAPYVDKVALHAYRVTDEDVVALKRAGQSDNAIFEITVAAAVGAALYRLDRGMAALRGEEPD